jgi:hypothetical protein
MFDTAVPAALFTRIVSSPGGILYKGLCPAPYDPSIATPTQTMTPVVRAIANYQFDFNTDA